MKAGTAAFILVQLLLFSVLPAQAAEKADGKWQDEMAYFIMVDRFSNGDLKNDRNVDANDPEAYNGGDFQGIIDRLGYIKDMGFTTIILSPVFDNEDGGYHGYWVKDFYKTDEHFGSVKTFKKLVKKAHDSGMKVVIDFPANNSGPAGELLSAKGPEWFHEKTAADSPPGREEELDGWIGGLPDLDQENPEARKYLIDAAKWWIEETDIDGYRLDSAGNVPADFWSDFSKAVKSAKRNFYLLADLGEEDAGLREEYKDAGFDGFYDYSLQAELRAAFKKPDHGLSAVFGELDKVGPADGLFVDNHHTNRFTKDITDENQFPTSPWKQALTLMFASPGIPIVYYGSEIALNGGKAPDNMKLMNFREEKDLIDYIAKLSELRRNLPSLTNGSIEVLYEKDGMVVFKRVYDGETAVIAINNTSKTQSARLTPDHIPSEDKELRGLLNDDKSAGGKDGYKIVLDREESEIYLLAEKQGINFGFIAALAAVWAAFAGFIYAVIKRGKRNPEGS